METINHQRARQLLQAAADKILIPQEKLILEAHLAQCAECQGYASHLTTLEDDIRRLTNARWGSRRPSLSANTIKQRAAGRVVQSQTLGTARNFALIAALAFTFVILTNMLRNPQFSPNFGSMASRTPASPLYTPTPEFQSTATQIDFGKCEKITYIVQQNDTLETIALKFSVSKDLILLYNGLTEDKLEKSMTLTIPLCQTPTGSPVPPTNTSTTTPMSVILDLFHS